ncbi:DUF1934 domain-containing protein [Acetanaerobacterium elongatum]|uniref:Uncharacterized beta-barrel protein YwiB, DUF1934 family n=1 Tax=Acetanaerobacterium elongatum TaxID=258515 RepID=A0A1H0GB69_9FIRM|nr:DUF1934 domain-containing protein [Acetanaerobacterium elongatum]SDO04123.1 Uncharacterized beta-barrel protein YwiB, DUF1934 family [Acetanaerobacterium elongatum]
MKKDVLISIKGISNIDGEEDIMELMTVGNLFVKDGKQIITYKESEATGFEGTTTMLELTGTSSVILKRRGANRSELIIEKGRRHLCHYDTGAGDIMIGVFSDSITNTLGETGGDVSFKYSLDINSSLASENEVYINVKECQRNG